MPGFIVGPIGDPVPAANLKPFYTYTWDIPNLFLDDMPEPGSPKAYEPPQDQRGVTIFAKECTLPTFSTGREEVDGASIVYKFASMVNWEDVRISFYDIPFRGEIMADRLRKWRNRVWTPEHGLGFADIYKRQSKIRVFNMDTTLTYAWLLYGSWPQSIRDGDMSYTQSEVKVIEVVVVYDWAETENVGSDELETLGGGPDDYDMPEGEYPSPGSQY